MGANAVLALAANEAKQGARTASRHSRNRLYRRT